MLERFLPSHDAIKRSRLLRWLGPRIHDPLLWHINRRAVARGVAMGVFFGLMIPIAQIPAAAMASLLLRGNLWIAAVSTLISNPLTYGPLYYFAYRLGAGVIGTRMPAELTPDELEAPIRMIDSFAQAWHWVTGIGQPLLVGMLIMAVTGATLGYWGTQLFWRIRVTNKWRHARRSRQLRPKATPPGPLGSA
ncbi:DUF2062 domain-containing protein [Thauera chlorobenzoica]|uniref:Uncharacterized protein n=1 Tax=Thauera chlorobenzoica TaxID=96773 RepID=A0A1H5TML0_9RHOO|nr:DUF2062 domain-containing protein [Thauera chlorobenzoica]APR06088.1 hypothetical protein Tchl_3282 [Thauera chlorobenzoica]SEF64014.1 hypothetical protein SAMN05216242_10397 [Thauera chlorobenzoica]